MKTRHRLLLYNQLSNQGIIRVGGVFGIVAVLWAFDYGGWLSLGAWQSQLWVALLLVAFIFVYYLLWVRRTYVYVKPDHLLVQGSFYNLRIPYGDVRSITPSQIAKHYPLDELKVRELRLLTTLYEVPCAFVRLDEYPVGRWARHLFFPRFLFTTERPGLLLLVQDWIDLTKNIEVARSSWLEKQALAQVKSAANGDGGPTLASVAAQIDRQSELPTILVIEGNSGVSKHLHQLLKAQQYDVAAANNSIDGLQLARQCDPVLILLNAASPRMELFHFLNALRRHRTLRHLPVLLMATREQTAAATDWMQAGVNDFLTIPFTDGELLFRIHNWLEVSSREQEYEMRIGLLHDKTLNQMSELMRRGELLNFLPATVAQQIMSGQISGRAQPFRRTKATVLFVDIVGFTDLTGRLDPTVLAELLNEYLREMTAAAIKFNGTVDKFIGDAVMVLYGAPQEADEEQQAWDAAQTAVEMLKIVEGLDMIWRSHLPRPLQVRVGFNTGYCTVGVFGNELLQSYTMVGSAVNIASRLQTSAQPNTIITSAESYNLIKNRVNARELGYLTLKNVNQSVEAYEILALGRPYK
ncbi:MAG: response regulator [Chloroflexi bacterium]|nr:response regulator [Chloroflexota bacterium]